MLQSRLTQAEQAHALTNDILATLIAESKTRSSDLSTDLRENIFDLLIEHGDSIEEWRYDESFEKDYSLASVIRNGLRELVYDFLRLDSAATDREPEVLDRLDVKWLLGRFMGHQMSHAQTVREAGFQISQLLSQERIVAQRADKLA